MLLTIYIDEIPFSRINIRSRYYKTQQIFMKNILGKFYQFILARVGLARKKSKFSSPGAGLAWIKLKFSSPGPVLPRQNIQILAKSTNSLPKYTKMSQFPTVARKKSRFSSPGKGFLEKSQNFPHRSGVGEEKSGFQTWVILAIPRPVPQYPAKGCLGKNAWPYYQPCRPQCALTFPNNGIWLNN